MRPCIVVRGQLWQGPPLDATLAEAMIECMQDIPSKKEQSRPGLSAGGPAAQPCCSCAAGLRPRKGSGEEDPGLGAGGPLAQHG